MSFKVVQPFLVCLLVLQNEASPVGGLVRGLPGPLEEGMSVKIEGHLEMHGSTFSVNLQTEPEQSATYNIGFHMRWNKNDETLHFNTWKTGEGESGHWENEEKHHGVARVPGRLGQSLITVRVTAREDHFHVNLNGKEFTFKYRMPKEKLKDLRFLVVDGDFVYHFYTWEREIGDNQYERY